MSSAGLPPDPASESPRSGIVNEYFPRKNLYHYIKMDFIFQYPLYLIIRPRKGPNFRGLRKKFHENVPYPRQNDTMITCQSR